MATLKELEIQTKPLVTRKSGKTYNFCRPFIGIWRKYNEFAAAVEKMEETANTTGMIDPVFLDQYAAFIHAWLKETMPGITVEEIESEFDILDIPSLKKLVMSFYVEIRQAAPPDFSEGSGEAGT